MSETPTAQAMKAAKDTILSTGQTTVELLKQMREFINEIRSGVSQQEQSKKEAGRLTGKGAPGNTVGAGAN